jgi:hypothetical protein
VAQRIEHLTTDQKVGGSNPSGCATVLPSRSRFGRLTSETRHDFWVLRDPWANEFCVLRVNFPDLLAHRPPWQD